MPKRSKKNGKMAEASKKVSLADEDEKDPIAAVEAPKDGESPEEVEPKAQVEGEEAGETGEGEKEEDKKESADEAKKEDTEEPSVGAEDTIEEEAAAADDSKTKDDDEEEYDPAKDSNEEDDDEGDGLWEVIKVLSIKEVMDESPIMCSTETCELPAALIYVSNLAPTKKWYSCLDCQAKDFGGWPTISELPIKHMTEEHKSALLSKCSLYKDVEMPDFGDAAASPGKDIDTEHASHTVITPPPNGAISQAPQKKRKGKSTITPSPAVGLATNGKGAAKAKPDEKVLATHTKWQEAAKAMGGPDARIVVSKPAVKKLIFDLLHDAFRPMNITQIYKELKAVVPSVVLKTCLDDMALDKSEVTFADSDEEDDEPKDKKPKASDDPYAGKLCFKAGKSSNSTLYYVDYTKTKNNGDGLEPDERNELLSKLANANAEEAALKESLKQMTAETTKLLSEPTNEEATARLETEEAALADLKEQLEEARKLKVNEKHKNQIKRRIQHMTAEWRKRRRLCMDFLIMMEENTEGTISVKQCLKGDGQIEIDSDEAVAAAAVAYGKQKRARPISNNNKKRSLMTVKKPKAKTASESGILPDENFVAVTLDSQGCVKRVYLDDDSSESSGK